MRKDIDLAIVIPAYKRKYFGECLNALSRQTCKRFRVYVGDDKSPENLEAIVDEFRDRLEIVYVRFDQNVGGEDLVGQWERCIDLVGDEDWIWFFSDDDRMDAECVGRFYEEKEKYPNVDLFHFNVRMIDGDGEAVAGVCFPPYPKVYSAVEFCRDRLGYKQQSYFVEFVFRKRKFLECGRFERFDLAWSSDVATCIKLAWPNGMITVDGARVDWRKSEINISPNNSRQMVCRKLSAVARFLSWGRTFFCEKGLSVPFNPYGVYLKRWITYRGKNGPLRAIADVLWMARTS